MSAADVLYVVVVFDALVVLVIGLVAAGMFAVGADFYVFQKRVLPATVTLVLTSLAAALIFWSGVKLIS